jgi:hypothetical protein
VGNFNLSLETYETVKSFKTIICETQLDLNALSLNFETNELAVEIQPSRVDITFGNESTDADESYVINLPDLSALFIRTSHDINVTSLSGPLNNSDGRIHVVLEEEGTVRLAGESWDLYSSRLLIEHRALATIQTEDRFIPDLSIDPPVTELFFEAKGGDTCNVLNGVECRKGPMLTAIVPRDTTVSQKDFLSANTIFLGENSSRLTFQYTGEAAVNYTFNGTKLEFSTNATLSFAGLTLWDSSVSRRGNGKLTLKVQRLVTDVTSLPNSSFLSFEVTDSCLILDNAIRKIQLTDTSVQVNSWDIWTPDIRQRNDASFTIESNSSDLVISVDKQVSDHVLSGLTLKCMAGATVVLEVSFYQVVNAEVIHILVMYGNRITLKTNLMTMPSVSVSAESGQVELTVVTKQPIFTAELAFWVFLVLAVIMGVISIVLSIVGHYCLPREEEFDVSTDEESELKNKRD